VRWIVQSNLYSEANFQLLIEALERLGVEHSCHKVVPFSHTLEPETTVPVGQAVFVMGTTTLAKIAEDRGWTPGSFLNENFDFSVQRAYWGNNMLNFDAGVGPMSRVPFQPDPFFIRPTVDSKAFAGTVMDWGQFCEWYAGLLKLRAEDNPTITPDTEVVVAPLQTIHSEARLWMVDKKVVTASGYKQGNRVVYSPQVNDDILAFGEQMARRWSPARAYCLDVASTPEGPKIIEVNNLSSAGFYAANMNKLVMAIESMEFD